MNYHSVIQRIDKDKHSRYNWRTSRVTLIAGRAVFVKKVNHVSDSAFMVVHFFANAIPNQMAYCITKAPFKWQ